MFKTQINDQYIGEIGWWKIMEANLKGEINGSQILKKNISTDDIIDQDNVYITSDDQMNLAKEPER